MKFSLYVEGDTERIVLGPFFKKWLDPQLSQPVRISSRLFKGSQLLWRDAAKAAQAELSDKGSSELLAVISIVDLAAELPYPAKLTSADERARWGRAELEKQVSSAKYRHFFAQHETEAWLLSQPDIFPKKVQTDIEKLSIFPERVNFDSPPAKRLSEIYGNNLPDGYKKTVDGPRLFDKLNPVTAYNKCPSLRLILDEMLNIAKAAGL